MTHELRNCTYHQLIPSWFGIYWLFLWKVVVPFEFVRFSIVYIMCYTLLRRTEFMSNQCSVLYWAACMFMGHFGYGHSQRQRMLHYKVVSHLLSPYPEWSLMGWEINGVYCGVYIRVFCWTYIWISAGVYIRVVLLDISMGLCVKDVTTLLAHWGYVFLPLTHWYVLLLLTLCHPLVSLSIKSAQHIDGLVQDCSISIANALEILQSYTEPTISLLLWLVV